MHKTLTQSNLASGGLSSRMSKGNNGVEYASYKYTVQFELHEFQGNGTRQHAIYIGQENNSYLGLLQC